MVFVFFIFLSLKLCPAIGQTNWIRAGYYYNARYAFPISNISSALFTHLICAYAGVNYTSYEVSVSPADEERFSSFTNIVKQKNPSVTTLLSVGGSDVNYSTYSSMVSNSSYRKSFIHSSIKIARFYGFQGLDFAWPHPDTTSDMFGMGVLFQEWKAAISLEATNFNHSQLILTARVTYSPSLSSASYPIEMMQHLNWVHVLPYGSSYPPSENLTGAHAALYSQGNILNMDHGVREWIGKGLSANKLVLILPFYGSAWMLQNPMVNGIGAPAKQFALNTNGGGGGTASYKEIKNYIEDYGPDVPVGYNSTYVVNYWTKGSIWIGFDDVEAVRAKISYAKKKKLLGYSVWQVSYDYNWVLSKTAAGVAINDSSVQEDHKSGQNNKSPVLVILLSTAAAVSLLFGIFVIFYCWRRNFKLRWTVHSTTESNDKANKAASAGDFNSNVPNLMEYTLGDIEAATNGFSIENKLGEGGYGSVYKGILPDGQVIAVKKLSKTFTQGFEEFKNEVMLTAKLQHVNLVRVLGFCIDGEEQIIIYEYVQNKSLDSYLFDPIRQLVLDWKKRVYIIEGVIQGLLYLQEYSRLTLVHLYLKVNNVLLDGEMKPKISDFGMPRIFVKDDLEVNTNRVAGTHGYSTKSDVYSFGILLLQIISGKRISLLYGPNERLSLPHYAYELWNDGKGMEFMDESLDDTYSSYKLMRCLQIALLCVQKNKVDRPSMLEVLTILKNEKTDIMIPKKPAFLKQNEQDKSIMQLEDYSGCTLSINDVTISDLVPR
ncbi:cysteine-rich receptor-like protein kinase 10 [Pistacia vera]|uniref:cysteine-rich receptor-like protein kinase 10 n=1 Tax=Pistacia vera TaxID=55513 RepID=UPI0012636E9C|nr:cysteine-rich receptor-like protein kinase 10 [Pistacia vera]